MQTKYYEPTIEEFHVGFEYELEYAIVHPRHPQFGETEWHNYTVDKIDDLEHIEEDIENEMIRVKYLDREDIESFNFTDEGVWRFKKTDVSGELPCWTMVSLRLWHSFPYVTIRGHRGVELDSTEQSILFEGNPKNKSELKKVLKQLNII